jgi:hypothetical protein
MSDHPPGELERGSTRRARLAIGTGVAAFVAIGIFWVLVFTGAISQKNPDRLSDRAWVARTEQRCKPVRDGIDNLPNAGNAKTADQRAATLDEGTGRLDRLVTDMAGDLPGPADEQRVVKLWLDDWHVYLNDRRTYAAALRSHADAQPLFTARHGESVKDAITNFADVNDMGGCEPPTDM